MQRYCGKANFIAGLVVFVRAFVSWIYCGLRAAKCPANDATGLHRRTRGRRLAMAGRLHTKRISLPLRWLRAFLTGAEGSLTRDFAFGAVSPAPLRITTDASPWGLGAVLHSEGVPVAWWSLRLEEADADLLGVQLGDSAGISVLEALAILIAVRTWGTPTTPLEVRADSAVALAAASRLKSAAPKILKIVLEASVDLALGRYVVKSFAHIPGVTNVEADALSRLYAPDPKSVPRSLPRSLECQPVNHRADAFWKVGGRRAPARRSCT